MRPWYKGHYLSNHARDGGENRLLCASIDSLSDILWPVSQENPYCQCAQAAIGKQRV